jgi:hypothetical protein
MVAVPRCAHFDLAAALECGQTFRWRRGDDGWFTGVVGNRVLRLRQTGNVSDAG